MRVMKMAVGRKYAAAAVLVLLVGVSIWGVYTTTVPEGGGAGSNPGRGMADWTVVFYFDGDNNLADYNQMLFNIECLEKVGSTDRVNMLVLLDRNQEGDTHAYYIKKGNLTEIPLNEINPEWTDEVNMGDPATLVNWTRYCVENYPAEHYNIMPSDHGGGWRGMCWDDGSGGDNLDLADLREALGEIKGLIGHNVDVFSVEACLVGMAEVGYEIRDFVDYYVAGETYGYGGENTTEGGIVVGNWQFTKVYGELASNPGMSPEQLTDVMIKDFQEYGPWTAPPYIPKKQSSDCLSVMNLSHMDAVASAADNLSAALLEKLNGPGGSIYREMITKAIGVDELPPEYNTESFSGQLDFIGISVYINYDLYDFAYQLTKTALGVDAEAQEVMDAVERAIRAERHGSNPSEGDHVDAHGMSVYIPYRQSAYNASYEDTAFAQDTHWDEFIKAYWLI